MNLATKYLFFFLAIIGSLSAFAQKVYTIDDVPNVHLQDRNAYVSDPEQKLSLEHRQQLNEQLRFFEDSLAVQCATIVLPAIDDPPSIFAHDLFNKWGVGDKETDRGLVILLVYGDGEGSNRDIYIATGYGLEGELPDALLKMTQVDKMVPLLKEEKFGEGLIAGLDYIQELLSDTGTRESILGAIKKEDRINLWFGFLAFLLVGFLFCLILLLDSHQKAKREKNPYLKYIAFSISSKLHQSKYACCIGCFVILFFPFLIPYSFIAYLLDLYKRKRLICPHCNTAGKMSDYKMKVLKEATKHIKGIKEYTFTCRKCGNVHKEEKKYKFTSIYSGGSNDDSSGSSYSSSSSSSGGSWGGGSSGGGGSGTSF